MKHMHNLGPKVITEWIEKKKYVLCSDSKLSFYKDKIIGETILLIGSDTFKRGNTFLTLR